MKAQEIARLVESKFQQTMRVVRITMKDGKSIEGSFEAFKDYAELREKLKYRFVPLSKETEFKSSTATQKEFDTSSSIIVDCNNIAKVEFVLSVFPLITLVEMLGMAG
ncbi:MAG: hypothetical protein K0S12_1571 [Bacteroidetes bacterium]|jgi:hypothetical protein|nr:hypothetical protein [Bacteroidota bacterium]